ncbi:hypothetical protein BC835DRAFT_1306053 [Cytidiella melzeri]|nr:hypothetical protein BC835DRAFT_1306053 [Cytidiella melzeri]
MTLLLPALRWVNTSHAASVKHAIIAVHEDLFALPDCETLKTYEHSILGVWHCHEVDHSSSVGLSASWPLQVPGIVKFPRSGPVQSSDSYSNRAANFCDTEPQVQARFCRAQAAFFFQAGIGAQHLCTSVNLAWMVPKLAYCACKVAFDQKDDCLEDACKGMQDASDAEFGGRSYHLKRAAKSDEGPFTGFSLRLNEVIWDYVDEDERSKVLRVVHAFAPIIISRATTARIRRDGTRTTLEVQTTKVTSLRQSMSAIVNLLRLSHANAITAARLCSYRRKRSISYRCRCNLGGFVAELSK